MKNIPVFTQRFLILAAFFALSAGSQSAPPAWWSEGNPPAVDPNTEQNNHGPANIGQAKWMARSVLRVLRTKYPTVAAEVESNLVGPGRIIPDWNPPFDQAARESNHAPLLIGQLKALSAPLYDSLHTYEPAWLESQLAANQTKDVANPTNYYPWTVSVNDDQNNAPATVGQLKAAFSLRFSEIPDSDSDGIPDSWESAHGMDSQDASDSQGDLDGDGLTNWEEFLLGTNPNLADSDGDGDPDGNDPDSYGTESDSSNSPEVAGPTAPPEQLYLNFVDKGYNEHYFEQYIYYESDLEPDHFEISSKTIMKSTVNGTLDNIYETLLYRMTSSEASVLGGCKQKAFPRFEEIDDVRLDYSRVEAPMLIPYALFGFGEISYSEPYWSYEEGGGLAKSVLVRMERRKIEAFERSHAFLKVYRQHGESMALVDGEVIGVEAAVLAIPEGATKSNVIKLEVDSAGKTCSLLPVEVVELSPKLRDADNNEIAGSEVPKKLPVSNSMVEEAPNTNRIAHREMKVMVGSALKDKKITWTMDAKFTPEGQNQPTFRGDWARAATTHRDRFETSTAYGAHACRRISQEQAETTVDADGFTAIRVNMPPIGFNRARIKIQIEGTTTPVELIDLDVQAVVVIDPGHGGTPDTDFPSASWNNSTSPSGVLEKTMALSYGQELKTSLETHIQAQRLNIKVLMTRATDVSVSGRDRAYLARDNGADQLFIIHFNALDDGPGAHTARGSLEVRQNPNLAGSLPEDIDFIDAVLDRMVPAMQVFDAGCSRHGHFVKDTTVATDLYMGNEENYHPVRAGYCEVEFIDFGAQTPNDRTDDAVDILLNTGPNAGAVKTAIANAMRDGIVQDLRTQPRPAP